MRIALIHSTGTLWLAGNPASPEATHSSAGDLLFRGRIGIQTDRKIRATASTHTDRGNLESEVSFSTSRQFASAAEAEIWSALYDSTQPRTGTLSLCGVDGATTAFAFLTGAVVEPPERQVIGTSVQLRYTVVGGLVQQYVTATATLDPTGANNAILLTAVPEGEDGNVITGAISAAATAAATAAAAVANAVTITPASKARMVVAGMTGDAAAFNGTWVYVGIIDSKPCYTSNGQTVASNEGVVSYGAIVHGSGIWQVYVNDNTSTVLFAGYITSSAAYPDGLTYETIAGTGTATATAAASSAAQCILACASTPAVAALVTATNAPGSNGTGTVAAVTTTPLTGGIGDPP